MKRRLLQEIAYLFIPEESPAEKPRTMPVTSPGRKYLDRVSFKAIFWTGTAVVTALLIGRLS